MIGSIPLLPVKWNTVTVRLSHYFMLIPFFFSTSERSLCFAFTLRIVCFLLCEQVHCPSLFHHHQWSRLPPAAKWQACSWRGPVYRHAMPCYPATSGGHTVQSLLHLSLLGIGCCHLDIVIWPDRLTSSSQGQHSLCWTFWLYHHTESDTTRRFLLQTLSQKYSLIWNWGSRYGKNRISWFLHFIITISVFDTISAFIWQAELQWHTKEATDLINILIYSTLW